MIELAHSYTNNNQIILLTYGTNGNGGLGLAKLDNKTKRYDYIFVSVNSSCIIGSLDAAIKAFNQEIKNHLNLKYGKEWQDHLKQVVRKKIRLSLQIKPATCLSS